MVCKLIFYAREVIVIPSYAIQSQSLFTPRIPYILILPRLVARAVGAEALGQRDDVAVLYAKSLAFGVGDFMHLAVAGDLRFLFLFLRPRLALDTRLSVGLHEFLTASLNAPGFPCSFRLDRSNKLFYTSI